MNPSHGGLIVVTVLGDAALREEWEGEVAAMRTRIADMREVINGRSADIHADFLGIQRPKNQGDRGR